MKAEPLRITVADFKRVAAESDLTVTIRVSRPLRFRLWLAIKAAQLAAWLAGTKSVVEE